MFDYTKCHSVMVARGALKTPWLASLYRNTSSYLNEAFLLEERKKNIELYFYELEKDYKGQGLTEDNILKRFKALSRYIFDDFENHIVGWQSKYGHHHPFDTWSYDELVNCFVQMS